MWGRKKKKSRAVNVVINECNKCNKMIPLYGGHYPNHMLDEFCNCDTPIWSNKIIQKEVYEG
jgi:hypothetical protein